MTIRIATIVGARPQFIKASMVSRILQRTSGVEEDIIHTGQHFQDNMSELFFKELQIPDPSFNLGINGGSHGDMVGRMLIAAEKVLLERRPECVVVYGDTNSTLAGSLSAAKLGIPVAHVEAGLRSYLKNQPEEINRVATDHLSSLLLCPTRLAVKNLFKEGVTKGVFHVGDVMYDAAQFARSSVESDVVLQRYGVESKKYCLATVHRAENTDTCERLAAIIEYLKTEPGDLPLLMSVHPRTRQALVNFGLDLGQIKSCDPTSYYEMAALTHNACTVFTDSGGLQKEAYFHRVPCVTLRDQTEWIELLEAGWNRLWTEPEYKTRKEINDYGSGSAAKLIVDKLIETFT